MLCVSLFIFIAVGCSSMEIHLILIFRHSLFVLYLSCSYIFTVTSKVAMNIFGCAL